MSVQYSAVKWNRNKYVYDITIAAGVVLYLAIFILTSKLTWTRGMGFSDEVLLIRALGTCGILMLHVVLCIGPLARLDRRFLPVLYNRRHLGVATFLLGLAHAGLATGYYHGFGRLNPLVSLLTSNTNFLSFTAFPFELFGVGALAILFLLASTSHDFWQKNLSASVWKGLHMLVYPAYGLLVWHVCLGALQAERSWLYPILFGTGMTTVAGLHLATGMRERHRDVCGEKVDMAKQIESWVDVGSVDEIPESRAKVVCLAGRERVAIFRHEGQVSAVTNVCAHQRGPLGEGKIVDGCITCPWHGWQYLPHNGQSPPPFHERITTYQVSVRAGRIWLNPQPLPPGTAVEPANIEEFAHV
jgi:sulfoxide reductase heme-binding subunit YedZ